QAALSPAVELRRDGAPRREVVGQLPPLTAGPQDVEDGVEEVPPVDAGGAAHLLGLGQQGPQQLPLAVGQVARIRFTFAHTSLYKPFANPLLGVRPVFHCSIDFGTTASKEANALRLLLWLMAPWLALACHPESGRPRGHHPVRYSQLSEQSYRSIQM